MAKDKMGFHAQNDALARQLGWVTYKHDTQFTYTFANFFHPFVGELLDRLNTASLPGMLDPTFHKSLTQEFFDAYYTHADKLAEIVHFPKEIDLNAGPYANYNWELLFHVPLTIAVHLSKNQRFAEAQRWFHYIFDPTCNDTSIATPRRFWRFLAFREGDDPTRIDEVLALLSKPDPTPHETELRDSLLAGYQAIHAKPFRPHAVARTRLIAYQYAVVMKYLDNLIAWGDSLFRQDTVEAIDEATMRYVLAANLLGARPQRTPPLGGTRPKTFAELRQKGLDALGDALVELEGKFPFNLGTSNQGPGTDAAGPLFGIGRTLYFCVPQNDRMLTYWDTVADRLFKIRNSLNIEGVFRQLALFDPPLDPGMLVKAAAAGIDIGSLISGLNQPAGPVRSLLLIQKALELCSEVRGLGGALLSAIEKGDAERMALLRQGHEINIQQLAQEVRFLQWKQAQAATDSLERSRASALERYRYYQRLLGVAPDSKAAPDTLPLDRRELTEENFDQAYAALVGQYEQAVPVHAFPGLRLAGEGSPAGQSGASGPGKLYLNFNEDAELNDHLPAARDKRSLSGTLNNLASIMTFVPELDAKLAFWGLGAGSRLFGGSKMSDALKIGAGMLQNDAAGEQEAAGMASRTASYERRADDWTLQSNLAARELMQVGRQILGSLIAEQVTHHDYLNIQKQIEHAQEVDQFLRDKFSNAELYAWMQGEIARLYYEYYRFAFDTARKAEQSMKRELMRPEVDATDFVKFNYWDGGRKGLLSGEALYLDVKRMELAYHEHNKREYELTKHVSLRQLNPVGLLSLKATGACEVTLPEWLFDLDGPGHYLRRIKHVSLSIPSVTGPYTSVNCTLTMTKSSLRKAPLLADGEYARQGSEDTRFLDYFGTIQSIVTSNANNDSGMFEANLRDERLLPFEGTGAVSTWKLELPGDFRQFDYNTIADVILHVRYTARQGGAQLRDKAVENLTALVADANASGLVLLLSLPHDFPDDWYQFVSTGAFAATVKREYFPCFTQGRAVTLNEFGLYGIQNGKLQRTLPLDATALSALSGSLQDGGAFSLTLAPDAALVRQQQAQVFAVIGYSVE